MGSLGDKFKKLAGDQTRQLLQNFQNAQSSKTRNGYSYGKLNEDGTATLADGTVVQVEVKGRPGQYAPVFNLGNGQGLVDQPEAKFFTVDNPNKEPLFLTITFENSTDNIAIINLTKGISGDTCIIGSYPIDPGPPLQPTNNGALFPSPSFLGRKGNVVNIEYGDSEASLYFFSSRDENNYSTDTTYFNAKIDNSEFTSDSSTESQLLLSKFLEGQGLPVPPPEDIQYSLKRWGYFCNSQFLDSLNNVVTKFTYSYSVAGSPEQNNKTLIATDAYNSANSILLYTLGGGGLTTQTVIPYQYVDNVTGDLWFISSIYQLGVYQDINVYLNSTLVLNINSQISSEYFIPLYSYRGLDYYLFPTGQICYRLSTGDIRNIGAVNYLMVYRGVFDESGIVDILKIDGLVGLNGEGVDPDSGQEIYGGCYQKNASEFVFCQTICTRGNYREGIIVVRNVQKIDGVWKVMRSRTLDNPPSILITIITLSYIVGFASASFTPVSVIRDIYF